jgi:hypothetical protein
MRQVFAQELGDFFRRLEAIFRLLFQEAVDDRDQPLRNLGIDLARSAAC